MKFILFGTLMGFCSIASATNKSKIKEVIELMLILTFETNIAFTQI